MDLPTKAFMRIRARFFNEAGQPLQFQLREKRNTQDDPFDELLANEVLHEIPGVTCVKAPGPLVTPDLVLFEKSALTRPAVEYRNSLADILAVEVKKLERDERGKIARASGLDFNTTPPCGTICVYDKSEKQVWIRSFYLFVCIEHLGKGHWRMTAMVLCDGNTLNSDEALYRAIAVDSRSKEIGLGSYGDGANRVRPMLIFGNPLGISHMDHAVTLIHPSGTLSQGVRDMRKIAVLNRTPVAGSPATFHCYRYRQDMPIAGEPVILDDPFPTPQRDTATRGRGHFTLPFST